MQAEEGFVSDDGIEFCAEQLGLTQAEVTAVASFYTMYKRRPPGEFHVGVCTNSLCAVMGGDAIFADLSEHLDIGNDESTADGKVSLEHLECNAACDYAPVVMVNWEFFDNMTPQSARQLVDDLRVGHDVAADPRRRRGCAPGAGRRGSWPASPTARPPTGPRPAGADPDRPAGGQGAGLDGARSNRRTSRDHADPGPTAHWDEADCFTLEAIGGRRLPGAAQAWPWSPTRSSRRSRTRSCAAAAARASPPG